MKTPTVPAIKTGVKDMIMNESTFGFYKIMKMIDSVTSIYFDIWILSSNDKNEDKLKELAEQDEDKAKCCLKDMANKFTGFVRVAGYLYKSSSGEPGISSSFSEEDGEIDRMLYIYEGIAETGGSSGFGRFIHGYLDKMFVGYFLKDTDLLFWSKYT